MWCDGILLIFFNLFIFVYIHANLASCMNLNFCRRGTLSKMASFIVDSCRDQRFSLETWDGSKNDRLGSMHTFDHRRSVWYKN